MAQAKKKISVQKQSNEDFEKASPSDDKANIEGTWMNNSKDDSYLDSGAVETNDKEHWTYGCHSRNILKKFTLQFLWVFYTDICCISIPVIVCACVLYTVVKQVIMYFAIYIRVQLFLDQPTKYCHTGHTGHILPHPTQLKVK